MLLSEVILLKLIESSINKEIKGSAKLVASFEEVTFHLSISGVLELAKYLETLV